MDTAMRMRCDAKWRARFGGGRDGEYGSWREPAVGGRPAKDVGQDEDALNKEGKKAGTLSESGRRSLVMRVR